MVKLKTVERRIGVVGTYASGKTVFLTSLLNHLKEHHPDRFHLGDGTAQLRKFEELPAEEGWSRFEYERHRDKIVNDGGWPIKTRDRSQFNCRFERSDWRFSDALLRFYDMPGERIADGVMAAYDYAAWSDHLLHLLTTDAEYVCFARAFLDLLHHPEVNPGALLTEYRRTLARLTLAYKPYVSPSTFLLSAEGKLNKGTTAETMADAFPAGLGVGQEFVPLPPNLRQMRPDLSGPFALHYELYRQSIVLPLIQTLRSCHALIVLVDVTMLLRGGVGMYNDNRQLLVDLLDVLAPGQGLLGKVLGPVSDWLLPRTLRPSWITRIAFVATKLDQVHQDDQDHMIHLLRGMIERPVRDRDGLSPLFTNCSAVVSTRKFPSPDGQRWLLGLPVYDATGAKRRLSAAQRGQAEKYLVSALPSDWPKNWREGEYSFPDVYPQVPPRKDCPPEQLNLDRILDFVMA